MSTPPSPKRLPKEEICPKGKGTKVHATEAHGKPCAPYDPLASRMRLMAALWTEFEEWSQRAKEEEKPDPYVIKILQMLEQSMQKCDDLLERLKLLSPAMCGPEVEVDLRLCRYTQQDNPRLPAFFERMRNEFEQSAVPIISAKLPNETELLSQSDQHGSGSPIDVESCQGGETG